MHHFRTIRRVAIGAALTGAAIGAVPAIASAESTCKYTPAAEVVVTDGSGSFPVVIGRDDENLITISDGVAGAKRNCVGALTVGHIGNTKTIRISGPLTSPDDGYVIDQDRGVLGPGVPFESDGNSEIEVVATATNGIPGTLTVGGTSSPDIMRVGPRGLVSFGLNGSESDINLTAGASRVRLFGGPGDDTISGEGIGTGNTFVPLLLSGGDGADKLVGGSANDTFFGDFGDDYLWSIGGGADTLSGGSGIDHASRDTSDTVVVGDPFESLFVLHVGRLRLAPRVLDAEAGRTARLKMSWKHPKTWRKLRTVKVSLYRGNTAVGMIAARPARGRLSENGVVDLMPGSKLSHHGKWVTAKLALRLPKSLAGRDLRVDVTATDTRGRKQLEQGAGRIRVR